MSGVQIRVAVPDEAAALAATYREAYTQSEALGYPMKASSATADQVEAWIREHLVLAAAADDRLIGAVRLSRGEAGVATLSRLGVRPEWSGEGIGSKLLSVAEQHCREHGDGRIRLTTPEDHPYLVTFYRDHGYKITGTHPLDFREYDEVVMEKPLR